ncbi:MAG: glycine--tRNA ligase [Candidatus Helarchaeota archaeon]
MKMSEKIVALCAKRGIIFPSAEIYGGMAGFYDYGPIGVALRNRIRSFWRTEFIMKIENIYEIESSILLPKIVWDASGHVEGFTDILVECTKCRRQFRADHLIQDSLNLVTDGKTIDELAEIIQQNDIRCPHCKGELTAAQKFNLMFKTTVGAADTSKNVAFLRPETAQAMFLNFKRIQQTMRASLPFGIAQIGRSYRNEISPRNFLFRLREFEHLEIEFFVHPNSKNDVPQELWTQISTLKPQILTIELQDAKKNPERYSPDELSQNNVFSCKWLLYWTLQNYNWMVKVGLDPKRLRIRQQLPTERAHYAADCWDIEFKYSFGWKELQGNADRTDYDLSKHAKFSKKKLEIFLTETNERVVPHVIEPSAGLERIIQALLESTYQEDEERTFFKFKEYIAPYQIAIFPLVSREPLLTKAKEVAQRLKNYNFLTIFDVKSSIGRRYRRVDEIGVPYAVTIDYQTIEDNTVTIRNRDTMEQERVLIEKLPEIFQTRLRFL